MRKSTSTASWKRRFRAVENGRVQFDQTPVYMTADEEDDLRVAPGDIPVDEQGQIIGPLVPVRYRQDFTTTTPDQVDYVAVSPVQIVSVCHVNDSLLRA